MPKQEALELVRRAHLRKQRAAFARQYLKPSSPALNIIIAVILLVLMWAGMRSWLSFWPVIIVPAIMGAYGACLLNRSDMPLASILAGSASLYMLPPLETLDIIAPLTAVIPQPFRSPEFYEVAVAICAIYATSMVIRPVVSKLSAKKIIYVLLGVLVVAFTLSAFAAQRHEDPKGFTLIETLNFEPDPEYYQFDAFVYSKTFFLMEKGQGYYKAIKEAMIGRDGIDKPPAAVVGWRQPALFYIWHWFFDSFAAVSRTFILLQALVIVFGFLIARELSGTKFALPVAALISGYVYLGAVTVWLPFAEYWGLPCLMGAVYLFLKKKSHWAAAIALMAPLIRELFVFVYPAAIAGELAGRRSKALLPWAGSALAFTGFYFLHFLSVESMVGAVSSSAGFAGSGSLKLLVDAIFFSSTIIFTSKAAAVVLWAAGIIGLFTVGNLRDKAFLLLLALALPVAMLHFIGTESSYYWGVAAVPLGYIGLAPLCAFALKARSVSPVELLATSFRPQEA